MHVTMIQSTTFSLSLAGPNHFANNFMGYDSRQTSNVKHSTFVPLILSA